MKEIKIVTVSGKDYYIKKEYDDGSLMICPVNKVDDLRSELQDYTSEELIQAAVEAAKTEGNQRYGNVFEGDPTPMNFFTGEPLEECKETLSTEEAVEKLMTEIDNITKKDGIL